jgi:hypothetical protein
MEGRMPKEENSFSCPRFKKQNEAERSSGIVRRAAVNHVSRGGGGGARVKKGSHTEIISMHKETRHLPRHIEKGGNCKEKVEMEVLP